MRVQIILSYPIIDDSVSAENCFPPCKWTRSGPEKRELKCDRRTGRRCRSFFQSKPGVSRLCIDQGLTAVVTQITSS